MMVIQNRVFMRRMILTLLLLGLICPAFAKTIFVKQGSGGNGTSWTSAYGELQNALDAAVSGDQIWVAAGTYHPSMLIDGSTDLYRTFQMKNGVAIYGGFVGTETSQSQRDIYNNVTIFSGDNNNNDGPNFANTNDNCHHVFYHPGGTDLDFTAVLDGFTISGGYSHGSGPYKTGAGMYNLRCSPTIRNCTFTANQAVSGGGMYNDTESSPILINCIFEGNKGTSQGAGMFNKANSSPILENCIFVDNTTVTYYGGGMVNYVGSSPVITNCTFSGNSAARGGGIANISDTAPILTNCIFYGNSAAESDHEIFNSSSNPLIACSNIAGCLNGNSWDATLGIDGGGNIDANPYFDEYLQLQSGSPCIDAADGDAAKAADLFGNLRYDDPDMDNIGVGNPDYVDMGSYEYQGDGVGTPTLSSISISGSTQVDENSGAQYTATAYYSDGSTANVTSSASWSENSSYASISSSGYLTTSSVSSDQSCTITATYGGRADTHSVIIKNAAATLSSISISGSTQVDESSGSQYTCTAYYSDGSSTNVTSSASWSENSSYASISSSGYLSTSAVSSDKSCTITATYGGKSDSHSVTIKNAAATLSSIAISGSTQVNENSGAQYSATAYYSDGSTANVTGSASWSENSSYASISSSGYLTTSSVSSDQSCTITAAYGGKSDTHSVTIKNVATAGPTLTVSSSGASGVPISSSTGHGGTTNYVKTVNNGTTVLLQAPATWNGATFTGWTGSINSSNTLLWFTMDANKTVTANYSGGTTTTHTLSVNSSGASSVLISSSTGHGGTTNYTRTLGEGATVRLTAPAISGKTFTGWTGSVSSTNQTISLVMNANKSVTANYVLSDTPASPGNLTASAVGTTRINLSWTDNASNETGFKIERSTRTNDKFTQIATVGSNVTSYNDTTVRKGTRYYYRVRATNANGDSAYSNQASATTPKK